jgi:hypothetical protein
VAKTNEFSRYSKADVLVKQRIIAASVGEPGSGKTTFWLTAPAPIVVMSFDKGLEGVVEPFAREKEIYVAEYEWAPAPGAELDQQEAIDLREKFTEDFEHAIVHARTVVWDKETDVWGLFKYAEFGVSEKGKPQDWDSLKQRVRRLINMPKALDINFGLIQGMKNEWVPEVNKKTGAKGITQSGNRIRAGMDDVESLVHVNIEHVREQGKFVMKIGKSRGPGSRDVQDQTFSNLTFSDFAQMVFPDSSPEDWA